MRGLLWGLHEKINFIWFYSMSVSWSAMNFSFGILLYGTLLSLLLYSLLVYRNSFSCWASWSLRESNILPVSRTFLSIRADPSNGLVCLNGLEFSSDSHPFSVPFPNLWEPIDAINRNWYHFRSHVLSFFLVL